LSRGVSRRLQGLVRQLLVMSPHPDDFYSLDFIKNLVDEPVLDIHAPGSI
jgi:hypothetical protein